MIEQNNEIPIDHYFDTTLFRNWYMDAYALIQIELLLQFQRCQKNYDYIRNTLVL